MQLNINIFIEQYHYVIHFMYNNLDIFNVGLINLYKNILITYNIIIKIYLMWQVGYEESMKE